MPRSPSSTHFASSGASISPEGVPFSETIRPRSIGAVLSSALGALSVTRRLKSANPSFGMPRKKWLGAFSGRSVCNSPRSEVSVSAIMVKSASPAPSDSASVIVRPPGPPILARASAISGWRGRGARAARWRISRPTPRKTANTTPIPATVTAAISRTSDSQMASPASARALSAEPAIKARGGQALLAVISSRSSSAGRICPARPSGHRMNASAVSRP